MSNDPKHPELLTLVAQASVDLQAADKPALMTALAYSGGIARISGWGDVLIDAKSVKLGKVTLLSDHDSSRSGVIGSGHATYRQPGQILVEGSISRSSQAGGEIIALSKDGISWEASVGIEVGSSENIRPGESVTANGKSFQASENGLTLVKSGILKEVSIVSLGADPQTSVSIAASFKGKVMSEETITSTSDSREIQFARLTSTYIQDRPHCREEFEVLEAQAIDDGWDSDRLELELIRAGRPRTGGLSGRHVSPRGGLNRQTLEASLLLRAGREKVALKNFGQQIVEQAQDLRIRSMVELCRAALTLDGGAYLDRSASDDQVIKAAFSTVSVPTILSNVMGKSLEAAYTDATADIRLVATIKSAADFKAQVSIRPTALQTLEEVGAGGQIAHTNVLEEDTYAWSVGTFARMVGITRTALINDDLSFFDSMPVMLATAAARALADLFWSTLLGGETASFFSSGNGNLISSDAELSIDNLAQAIQVFREQRDSRGNDLAIRPAALVVSPALETTARALLNSTEIVAVTGTITPSGNPVSGIVPNLIVAPQLSNSDKFAGADSRAWYLLGGPETTAIIMGFLDGRQVPTVETEDAPFNVLGIQLRYRPIPHFRTCPESSSPVRTRYKRSWGCPFGKHHRSGPRSAATLISVLAVGTDHDSEWFAPARRFSSLSSQPERITAVSSAISCSDGSGLRDSPM